MKRAGRGRKDDLEAAGRGEKKGPFVLGDNDDTGKKCGETKSRL